MIYYFNTTTVTSGVNSVVLGDLINNSFFVVIFLLLILALKVIVSSETQKSPKTANFDTSLNMVIFPLLLVLLFLVAYMANFITTNSI